MSERANLSLTAPFLSISSDKVQGEPYLRENRGLGDVILTGGYRVLSSPDVVLEAGVRLPTGSTDRTDGLGTRINDILALGSGTADPIAGLSVYKASVGRHGLDVFGSVRHRFTGGTNKWGYRFGNESAYSLGATYLIRDRVRVTPVLSGYHLGIDTWYGNTVPERGATFVHFAPEVAWEFSPGVSLGAVYRIPVWLELEGAQMVADRILGLTGTFSLASITSWLKPAAGDGGLNPGSPGGEGE